MNLFEYIDYKKYVNDVITSRAKGGRGEYRRLAGHLKVSTTMVSQVFNGEKHLNLELASELCDYFSLSENETEYFFLLIENARAGSFRLQQKLGKRIKEKQKEAERLSSRLKPDKELNDQTRAIYYSSWMYAGVRNLVATPEGSSAARIAEHLHLPPSLVQKVLDFMIQEGILESRAGKLEVGGRRTHIPADSPLVAKHHQNWRIHGFQKMLTQDPENLFYTAPMSVSHEVAIEIRKEIPAVIERINKWVIPSTSEVVKCLNIDWFSY